MDEEPLRRQAVGDMGALVGLMQWGEDRQGRDLSWERCLSPMGHVRGLAWALLVPRLGCDDHPNSGPLSISTAVPTASSALMPRGITQVW